MRKNCLLCGVGGQGTILASKLIADSALLLGTPARAAETIGMAQRGGSVTSHVRIGKDTRSPMIPRESADVLIAFEPGEAVRNLGYLKKNGVLVVSKKAVKPTTATLIGSNYDGKDMLDYLKRNVSHLIIVDGDEALAQIGSPKVLNVILLGAAVGSGQLGLTIDDMEAAIKNRLPERFHQLNFQALHMGASLAQGKE